MDNSTTLHQLFETEVSKNPHQIALTFGKNSMTYHQLNNKANKLAHYLRQQGIKPDMPVVICMERSFDFFIALLGILKAGGAYIPLDYSHPKERLLFIAQESNASIIITNTLFQEQFNTYKGQVLLLDNQHIETQASTNPKPQATKNNLAYVIYTSGSTGTPKGVLIEHQSIVNYTLWFAKECVKGAKEKIDCSANPAFDFALTLTIVPLTLGLSIIICDELVKKDPRRYIEYLQANNISLIKITPSYFRVLFQEIEHQGAALPRLKKIMLGGENLTTQDCRNWLNTFPHHSLFNEYGPTETSVAVSLYEVNTQTIAQCNEIIPIGYLVPNAQYHILNDLLEPVAAGETGELYMSGLCVARGYLNNQLLTDRYFITHPSLPGQTLYKTGDLCRVLANQALDCIGRIDHQLKIRGFRVELEEIEHHLLTHSGIKNAAVIASEQFGQEKKLIAYYTTNPLASTPNEAELRQYLARFLPDYMLPSFFMPMEKFPRNSNDKLDRAALPLPQVNISLIQAPKTPLEKKLAAIWQHELGLKSVGIHDHFFELGGHSLSAARVISKINHQFKRELSLQRFYQTPTIAALSQLIKQAPKVRALKIDLQQQKNQHSLPLSDFQLLLWLADTFEPKAKKLNIFTRKRISGTIDVPLFNKAVDALIQKHHILSYRVSKFHPHHAFQKHQGIAIEEHDHRLLKLKDSEDIVEESFNYLKNYHSWPKNKPQIRMRLFHLSHEQTELQISMPHFIADDACPDILLRDLSDFYQQQADSTTKKSHVYQEYILQEQHYLKQHAQEDERFWDDYLKDTSLFSFPVEQVITDMHKENIHYSTYTLLPEESLSHFKNYCAQHHISILDGLCAVLVLALNSVTEYQNNSPLCINRVKSTRDDEDYDHAIGCFLRLEPIRLLTEQKDDLHTLAQKIHQEIMHTTPFQKCSSLIKLASLGAFRQSQNKLKEYSIKWGLWLYNTLMRLKLDNTILASTSRLNTVKGNQFLINVNVQNNFIHEAIKASTTHFLGLKVQPLAEPQTDMLKIDNLLDVCFVRQEDNLPFLVLSANLAPQFRQRIAQKMVEIIGMERIHSTHTAILFNQVQDVSTNEQHIASRE